MNNVRFDENGYNIFAYLKFKILIFGLVCLLIRTALLLALYIISFSMPQSVQMGAAGDQCLRVKTTRSSAYIR